MDELTPRQREVLDLIRRHIDETGYPPTRADIAAAFGFRSANAAEEHLRALARKGVLEIAKGTSRGIKLAADSSGDSELRRHAQPHRRGTDEHAAGLPIIGRVAAGAPILAAAHIEAQCEIAAHAFRPPADYLLRVRGDSMLGIGIIDGDLLAVHAQATADSGQVVVARIDDEVTVKRLANGTRAGVLQLLAENPDFAPIEVDLKRQAFSIEGLAVGVIRTRL